MYFLFLFHESLLFFSGGGDEFFSFLNSFNQMFFGFEQFDNVCNFKHIKIDQHTSNLRSKIFVFGLFLDHGVKEFSQHGGLLLFFILGEISKIFLEPLKSDFLVFGFGLGLVGSRGSLLVVSVLSSRL